MISASLACSSLALVLALGAPMAERAEVGRAQAVAALSHTGFGTARLDFRTLAPGPNTNSITGTIQQETGIPWLVHRILMDTGRGLYYGYDLELSKGDGPDAFVVAVKALAAHVDEDFRRTRWRDFCRDCPPPRPVSSTTQRFPSPRAVTVGDTLSIDLLADERSGELITDRVTLLPTNRSQREDVKVMEPRDLRPEVVNLQMAEATLRVNGKPAWGDSSDSGEAGFGHGGSVQGEVVWTEVPGRGRVFLSLAPWPGYDFKKIGIVAGDRISFTIDGDRYEWISNGPIVTAGPVPPFMNVQSWYVWLLHDADYRPASGSRGDHSAVGAGFDERAANRLKRP